LIKQNNLQAENAKADSLSGKNAIDKELQLMAFQKSPQFETMTFNGIITAGSYWRIQYKISIRQLIQ
jgi:hypothetical protein